MGKNIFYLENNEEYYERAIKALENDFKVTHAENTLKGLNILENLKEYYTLFLLDCRMPTFNKFDCTLTNGGILTGVYFYKDKICDEIYKGSKRIPPAIFLTAIGQELENKIKRILSDKVYNYGIISKHEIKADFSNLGSMIEEELKKMY